LRGTIVVQGNIAPAEASSQLREKSLISLRLKPVRRQYIQAARYGRNGNNLWRHFMNSQAFLEAIKPFTARALMEPQVDGHVVVVEPHDRPRLLKDPGFTLTVLEKRLTARLANGGDPLDIAVQCKLPAAVHRAEFTNYATSLNCPSLARVVRAAAAQRQLPRWQRRHDYHCKAA
jgi:hypothetical protein